MPCVSEPGDSWSHRMFKFCGLPSVAQELELDSDMVSLGPGPQQLFPGAALTDMDVADSITVAL